GFGRSAGCLGQVGLELKGEAFVAAGVMLVRTHVLIARVADQHGACHQLVDRAAHVIAEGAFAHVGYREPVMELGIRPIAWPRRAAVVVNRHAIPLDDGCAGHDPLWRGGPRGSRLAPPPLLTRWRQEGRRVNPPRSAWALAAS